MSPNFAALLYQLRALDLSLGDIVIVGSGPMAARGLLNDTGDLDVLARGEAWAKARTLGPVRMGAHGDRIISLNDGRIEVFDGWTPEVWPVEMVFATAQWFGGFQFARLEFILAVKRTARRPKDEAHIALIERHLKHPPCRCL